MTAALTRRPTMGQARTPGPAVVVNGLSFAITPRGPFSLDETGNFGFGQRGEDGFDGTMRLAFVTDGYAGQAGVTVTQDDDGVLRGEIVGSTGDPAPDPEAVVGQVARVLSADGDGEDFVALGERDPVLRPLFEAAPGLRPPLFYSPYEGALWAVLSMRRNRRTADAWRRRLSLAAGARFELAGREQVAVPLPGRLVELGVEGVRSRCGIEVQRAERVVAVAVAAVEGRLDADAIAAGDPDETRADLRRIPGIGPFSADLIIVRASGATDVLSVHEPRFLASLGRLYGLGGPATPRQAEEIAAAWSPWRTWAMVLVRAAGDRLAPRRSGSR